MRMPRSLKVGPHRYKIVLDHHGLLDVGDPSAGGCNKDHHVIGLSPRMAPSTQADTILHEAVHALLATVKLEDETEEAVALALGPGLLSLFRDNPALYPFLMAAR